MVNLVTEPGRAVEGAVTLAERIVLNAPTSIRATLVALDQVVAHDDGRGWAATDEAREAIMASDDRREGLAAFFERRAPEWPGR